VALAVETHDHAHALQAFGHVGEHRRNPIADAPVNSFGRRPEPQRQDQQHRHEDEERDQRELRSS
jgi:hypothetical protein